MENIFGGAGTLAVKSVEAGVVERQEEVKNEVK